MKKIIVTGANGFLGQALMLFFAQKNFQVIGLSRSPFPIKHENITYAHWDGKTVGEWCQYLEGSEAVINLAGKSVNCRYNEKNMAAIFASRLESTTILGNAIATCNRPPKVWMNAASATIYAHSLDQPNSEASGIIGDGFSVEVCKAWESAFFDFEHLPVRQICLRMAIVLGKEGGVYGPLKTLAKLGMGGKMGPGNQQFSWIHIADFCLALEHLLENQLSKGTYNIAAPKAVRNRVFQRQLCEALRAPIAISQPKWLLEIGARIIKTETELVLKSRFVYPQRLLEEGFEFRYGTMEKCLKEIVG